MFYIYLQKGDFCVNIRLISKFMSLFIILNLFYCEANAENVVSTNPKLKFHADGTFKIVQFADIHGGPQKDTKAITLMNNVLNCEKPDLVILTGDNTDGKCRTVKDIKKAINIIAEPMESKNIPWAIAFGNHDDEHGVLTKKEMMKIYTTYSNNLSRYGDESISGVGNYNLLIEGSKSAAAAFNIYILDSGKYAPENIGGYDWIKPDQINWYKSTANALKEKYKRTIPAIMFFHIPLKEFKLAWGNGNTVGQRNEEENASKINSGLFSALLEIGDVKGVFCGHDHTNDYCAELSGIRLGYGRNVGNQTYGKDGLPKAARVFLIKENELENFQTWIRAESDF